MCFDEFGNNNYVQPKPNMHKSSTCILQHTKYALIVKLMCN
jgi:hypothetical protein